MSDSRDAVIVELGSVIEAIGNALDGEPVDDFSGSMPLVDKAVTMRTAAVHWEQIADKRLVKIGEIEASIANAVEELETAITHMIEKPGATTSINEVRTVVAKLRKMTK